MINIHMNYLEYHF